MQERNLFASIGWALDTYWAGNLLLGFMSESIFELFSLMKTFSNSIADIAARLDILSGWKGLSKGLGKASRHTVHFTKRGCAHITYSK